MMRLRSSESSKPVKSKIDSCLDNGDNLDKEELSLNSDNLSISTSPGRKKIISEDTKDCDMDNNKSLPLDSTKDLIVSCLERKTESIHVEFVPIPTGVCVGVEEQKELVSKNLNDLDGGLKEETKSLPMVSVENSQLKAFVKSRNRSENVELWSFLDDADDTKIINGNNDNNALSAVLNNHESGESVLEKPKRGRKRKTLKGSQCKGAPVCGRVLRPRTVTVAGGVVAADGRLTESVVGLKREIETESLIDKNTQIRPQKKQKRRGRPPQVKSENTEAVFTKVKHLGRPPKTQAGIFSKRMTKAKILQRMVVKDEVSEVKQTVKVNTSEENRQGTAVEDTVKGQNRERRKKQQAVRDQILSIIMNAGWTIEYRPRQQREYLDAVYVDQKGRTHWSITKAYRCLKKKIEDDEADAKEISAFTEIPDEAISVLFRFTTKIRSDKNKKKNKTNKGASKAEIVISGNKRKETRNASVKSVNKTSKARREHNIVNVSMPKCSHKSRKNRKPRLVARSSKKGSDQDNKKRNLLAWMMGLGVVLPGGKVRFGETRRKSKFSEGRITEDGIQCGCCNEVLCLSSFVLHAGGKLETLYLESGFSILKCMIDSWRKEEELSNIRFNCVDVNGGDPNDDTCNICGDGGDLICCDGCPSTFHQSCLDIQNFPSGDWRCIYCSCKFCGLVEETEDSHHRSCSETLSCCLCEQKFHGLCLQEEDAVNVDSNGLFFCGRKCLEIFGQLQKYLGVKFKLPDGFSWTLLQRFDLSQDSTVLDDPLKVECNSKLAVAFAVMDECFMPIVDERTGVNLIHNVAYNCGSNFKRLNYSRFFMAILERGDELISAASIRIHGNRLAEMPFVGTRHMYRRQGMCRRLLDAIEHALGSLGVGELVIPAIPELFKTWTNVFGFEPIKKSKRQEMKSLSLMVFPGTDMLRKSLFHDKNIIYAAVSDENILALNGIDNDAEKPTTSQNANSINLSENIVTCQASKSAQDHAIRVEPTAKILEVVPKNMFDLNLDPTIDEDSCARQQPQVCKESFELCDSRVQVCDSKTCAAQAMVLV